MRFVLATIVLSCLAADASACGNGLARRLVRAEMKMATAPLRAVKGMFGHRSSSTSVGVTVVSGGCPLPTAKSAPMPAPVPTPKK